MKKAVFSLFFAFTILSTFSQITFEKSYGSSETTEKGYSVCQTEDNAYVITGSHGMIESDTDVWLIKISENGDSLWSESFGTFQNDAGKSVKQCTDKGFIIAGYVNDLEFFYRDLCLIKTNEFGKEEWSKVFGEEDIDEGANSVEQTNDHGFIVAGYIGTGMGDGDVYLLRTDENGDTLWTKKIGGKEIDVAASVQQTKDNGYIIVGHTYSYGAGLSDVYLIKTDENGDTSWTRTYGGQDYDGGSSVKQTMDNGYIITGYTSSFGNGSKEIYLVKTDQQGDTMWTKVISGNGSDVGKSVQQTSDNGYIIVGYTQQIGQFDVWLIKTDVDGSILWDRIYPGGSSYAYGYSVRETSDNGYIISGERGSGYNADLYLIKTDNNGLTALHEDILQTNQDLKIHPNPAHGNCTVELNKGDKNMEIIDLHGQYIYCENFYPVVDPETRYIDLSTLPSGIYFIKIIGEKKMRIGKLILCNVF